MFGRLLNIVIMILFPVWVGGALFMAVLDAGDIISVIYLLTSALVIIPILMVVGGILVAAKYIRGKGTPVGESIEKNSVKFAFLIVMVAHITSIYVWFQTI